MSPWRTAKLRSIVINLDQAIPTDTLARELQLSDVRPVDVPDDSGELLGQAYPERGVLFSITPDGKRVSQVLLDKIDLSTFLLRAETDLQSELHASLADVDYVLSQQPKNARALWLRAQIMSTLARYDEALHDVDAALENDKAPLYRLTRAEILGRKGRYDDAIQESKNILGLSDLPRDIKAKAALPTRQFTGCLAGARLQNGHGKPSGRHQNRRSAFHRQASRRPPQCQTAAGRCAPGRGQRHRLRLLAAKRKNCAQVARARLRLRGRLHCP